jgi:hypothetical protein
MTKLKQNSRFKKAVGSKFSTTLKLLKRDPTGLLLRGLMLRPFVKQLDALIALKLLSSNHPESCLKKATDHYYFEYREPSDGVEYLYFDMETVLG